ncbi:MAG: acetyl ornithine aminotransferase family protein [Pirellulales bacterium]|nr:acetyl ornithine aminotransferase family protein [Pirellulales bacterium]
MPTSLSDTAPMPDTVPNIVTELPGPRAKALITRDQRVLSPSYTRDYPLVIGRAQACVVEDVDGNAFLDFTAGIAVTASGHAHPDVVKAISDQASKLIHMSGTDFYYAPEIELAERLAELAPGDTAKRVFFTNSGAETVEAAIKLSRFHTKRPRIISFYGAFHGRTYGAMSIGGSKSLQQQGFSPLMPGVHRLDYDCDRSELQKLFDRVAPPEEVAAIFVEPIQGEGGYIVPSDGFLPMLREVCDEHGIMLVCDEIQAGMGRTGKMFACEHFGVAPDLVCLAKGIASGLPLGALVAADELMDWPPGSHASTFGGNPVSCAAALATIKLIEGEYLTNAAARGEQLKTGLSSLCQSHDRLANARGLGLMQAADVVSGGQLDPQLRNKLVDAAFYNGLLLLGCGQAGIRFCPALCVTDAEIDTMLEIFGRTVGEVTG